MSRTITIDPVTRIEGHSKITIQLDERGEVTDAHFHVTQFRGFERIVQGRPVHEMPAIMARICGICPVSHLVASAKAVRRHPGRGPAAHRGGPAPAHQPGPDRAVERAVVLPPLLAGPALRLRRRPRRCATSWPWRRRTRSWRTTASACASGASRSSSCWAASASIPSGIVPGGVAEPAHGGGPRPDPGRRAGGHRPVRAGHRLVQDGHDALGGGGLHLRQLPLGLHGPRGREGQRRPLRRLAARRGRRQQQAGRSGSTRASSTTTSARPWSPGRT